MANERRWSAVSIYTSLDGTLQGKLTVSDVGGFYVKSKVRVFSNTQPSQYLEIKKINGTTDIYVGAIGKDINDRTDMSLYLVADGTTIILDEQIIPTIKPEDVAQSVFAREPIVANRAILVDKYGQYYDTNNPLPMVASFTGDLNVAIDALTPPNQADPNNILIAGSEDGTKGGLKHAARVDSSLDLRVGISNGANKASVSIDGKLAVDDADTQVLLQSLISQLQSGSLSIGTEDGTETGVQHVFINNLKSMLLASQDRIRNVTYLDPSSKKNRRVEKFEFTSATFPGITLVREFNYNLIGTEYVFINDNWTLI